jgi:hypothetical protein
MEYQFLPNRNSHWAPSQDIADGNAPRNKKWVLDKFL